MLFRKGGWYVEIDVEKTTKAYQLLAQKNQFGTNCSCSNCENVNIHLNQGSFPQQIIDNCDLFGIHYKIPGEFYSLGKQDNHILYHGFYSFYGIIKKKPAIYGALFFEDDSPLKTPNFPNDASTVLLGFELRLPLVVS